MNTSKAGKQKLPQLQSKRPHSGPVGSQKRLKATSIKTKTVVDRLARKLRPVGEVKAQRKAAHQRWITDSRAKDASSRGVGSFTRQWRTELQPIQMRGEIVQPSLQFSPNVQAVDLLTPKRHPLHLIGEFGLPALFRRMIESARIVDKEHGWKVAMYEEMDYAATRMFLSMDGGSGFAIKEDGDLISVFAGKDVDPRGVKIPLLLLLAVENGALKADCFDGFLPKLYSRFGFTAVCRLPWNHEMRPVDWPEGGECPEVVFLSYQGGLRDTVIERMDGFPSYDVSRVPMASSYDEAIKLQTAAIIPAGCTSRLVIRGVYKGGRTQPRHRTG